MKKYIAVLLFLVAGCSQLAEKHENRDYIRICLRCDAKITITGSDVNEARQLTTQWCFYDGTFCSEGLNLIFNEQTGWDFNRHCITCGGCRMAAFDPEGWKEYLDNRSK